MIKNLLKESKFELIFIIFFVFIIDILLYFILQSSPLDHHVLESIVKLNFSHSQSFFDYHRLSHANYKPLFYSFTHFIFYQFNISPLNSFILAGICYFNILILALYKITHFYNRNLFYFLFSIIIFFFFFYSHFFFTFLLEDNLSYFGFILLFLYSIHRKKYISSGIILGLATAFNGSIILLNFMFTIGLATFIFHRSKDTLFNFLKINLTSIGFHQFITQILLPNHYEVSMFNIIKRIITFDNDARYIFPELLNPLVFIYEKFFMYAAPNPSLKLIYKAIFIIHIIYLLKQIDFKKLFKFSNHLIYLSFFIISFLFPILYGPARLGRWDLFGIFIIYFTLIVFYQKNKIIITTTSILTLFNLYYSIIEYKYITTFETCFGNIYYDHYLPEKQIISKNLNTGKTVILPKEYLYFENIIYKDFNHYFDKIAFKIDNEYFRSKIYMLERSKYQKMINQIDSKVLKLEKFGSKTDIYRNSQLNTYLNISNTINLDISYRSPHISNIINHCK